jgi:hypothetical protein
MKYRFQHHYLRLTIGFFVLVVSLILLEFRDNILFRDTQPDINSHQFKSTPANSTKKDSIYTVKELYAQMNTVLTDLNNSSTLITTSLKKLDSADTKVKNPDTTTSKGSSDKTKSTNDHDTLLTQHQSLLDVLNICENNINKSLAKVDKSKDSLTEVKKVKNQNNNKKISGNTDKPNNIDESAPFYNKMFLSFFVFTPFILLFLYLETIIRNNKYSSINKTDNDITDNLESFSNHIEEIHNHAINNSNRIQNDTNINIDIESKMIFLSTSQIGKSHLQSSNKIPCQDSNRFINFGNGWGVVVVADGAGSAKLSHIGSNFVTEQVSKLIQEAFRLYKWNIYQELPSDAVWNELIFSVFMKVRQQLLRYAEENNVKITDYASTVIVTLFSPYGLAVAHIGDGRAGYCDANNEWHSMFTPHKGEEANQTLFLTSDLWVNNDLLVNGTKVPETNIVSTSDYKAFTLMSDGCEQACFELGHYDSVRDFFVIQNKPYNNFFNPLIEKIKTDYLNNMSKEDIRVFYDNIISSGNEKLKEEMDDKTLFIGIRY